MSRGRRPPTRFTDAEKINPFQLLIALHDHALDNAPDPAPDGALAELALAAAVVARGAAGSRSPSTPRSGLEPP